MRDREKNRLYRVALLSYDMPELRAGKNILAEEGGAQCELFQRGGPLLQSLREGKRYDLVLLKNDLEDMDEAEFIRAFCGLAPAHRPNLLLSQRETAEMAALQLIPEEKYSIMRERGLLELAAGAYRPDSAARIRCRQMYRIWGVEGEHRGCEYLTAIVEVALQNRKKLAIRKELMLPVSEEYNVEVSAVESGVRRLCREIEARNTAAWRAFKQEHGAENGTMTVGRLIYAMRDFLLEQTD